jgi:hypothetical protein
MKDPTYKKTMTFDSIESQNYLFSLDMLYRKHNEHRQKTKIQRSKICFCFYCQKVFDSKLIKEYVGSKGDKALCPLCGIDSVIAITKKDGPPARILALAETMNIVFFRLASHDWVREAKDKAGTSPYVRIINILQKETQKTGTMIRKDEFQILIESEPGLRMPVGTDMKEILDTLLSWKCICVYGNWIGLLGKEKT